MSRGLDMGARESYEAFAAGYDEFNHPYMYERWTGRLLDRAEENGLAGDRLLDVGCGTGLSFVVPLRRGMKVTGCDISPAMLAHARERAAGRVPLVQADMRSLPILGEFHLIWSVDDAINYLDDEAELAATLAGMRRNLAPGGMVLFDVNTLAGYRSAWVVDHSREHEGRRFRWKATPRKVVPGGRFEVWIEGDGLDGHPHRQRHFPEDRVRCAIEGAGMRCVAVLGESDGELDPDLDEEHHTKAVYICRADTTPS